MAPAAIITALALAALLSVAPSASALPVEVEEFAGGIQEAWLEFQDAPTNATLAFELPRGSEIVEANLTLAGIAAEVTQGELVDFNNTGYSKDLWALYLDGLRTYPPDLDPYTTGWACPERADVLDIKASDDRRWDIQTPGESLPPPLEWPVQLFHFRPDLANSSGVKLSWEGLSSCRANQTAPCHAEMWLYDHSASEWKEVANYSSNSATDHHLNHTVGLPSDFLNRNGSLPVLIVGIHAEGIINPPVVITDYGHLYTDYISALVVSKIEYVFPEELRVTVGDTEVLYVPEGFDARITLGDSWGLKDAIQAYVDSYQVRPGNLSVPIVLTVAKTTPAKVRVYDLYVAYNPPSNDAPGWEGPDTLEIEEDSGWTSVLDLEQAFTDDHNQGDLLLSVVSVSDPDHLEARVQEDLDGIPWLQLHPAEDFYGQVDIVLQARDLFDVATDSPPIQVTVSPLPDYPTIVDPGELRVLEGTVLDVTLTVDDPDLPDDELAFSDSTDLFDIDGATGRIVWTPGPDQVGTHEVQVTVTDSHMLSHRLLITIVVDNINNAPTITSPLTMEAVQDEPASYHIYADDLDIPFGDHLTFSATSLDVQVACDPSTGLVTFTPTNAHVPSIDITISVEDGQAASVEAVLVVSVENRNDPPSLEPIAPGDLTQGQAFSLQLAFDDPDLHVRDPPAVGETLTIASTGPEAFAPDAQGLISLTPGQELVGTHTVVYTVTDKGGLTAVITVVWTVLDVNDAPQFVAGAPTKVDAREDEAFDLQLQAEDLDGDALSWSDDSDLFDIGQDGAIAFTPLQSEVGLHKVTVNVSDGRGGQASWSFDLVISNVNDPPTIDWALPEAGSRFGEGERIRFKALASDEDGDALVYTWSMGAKVLGTGAVMDYSKLSPGKHVVSLSVSDGNASTEREIPVVVEEAGSSTTLVVAAIGAMVVVAASIAFLYSRMRGKASPPRLLLH